MKILVFGKDGQLGKAFKNLLDAKKLGQWHAIEYAGRQQCDLSHDLDLTSFLHHRKPDLIINAAAYTAVDRAESEGDLAFAINAKAPAVMAHYAAKEGASFLHYSTDYVFDGSKASPYLEGDVPNPLSIYGQSKALGEAAIEDAFNKAKNKRAQFAIMRTSWVYGDGSNFIRTILNLAKERDTLQVIANQYGVPTSADWLASMSLALVLDQNHQLRSFPSGIYHAVPQGETTWHALACYAVQVALDCGVGLQVRPDRIKPILAFQYPSPATRPTNSRLSRLALDTLMQRNLEDAGDVPKWQEWQQFWEEPVARYVQDLALHQRI